MRLADVVHGLAPEIAARCVVFTALASAEWPHRRSPQRLAVGSRKAGHAWDTTACARNRTGRAFCVPSPHCPSTNLLSLSLSYSVSTLFLSSSPQRTLPNPRSLQVQRVSLNLDKAFECAFSLDKATPDPNPSGSEREADPIQYCHLADGASPLSCKDDESKKSLGNSISIKCYHLCYQLWAVAEFSTGWIVGLGSWLELTQSTESLAELALLGSLFVFDSSVQCSFPVRGEVRDGESQRDSRISSTGLQG
jgi:hypothetical protein